MKTTNKLIFELKDGVYDSLLEDVVSYDDILRLRERLCDALSGFEKDFGQMEVSVYSAPYTIPLFGDFTEAQNGAVLSAAINSELVVVICESEDKMVHMHSEAEGILELDPWGLRRNENEVRSLKGLVRGILAELKLRGYKIGGFNAYVLGNAPFDIDEIYVPTFEILVTRAIFELFNQGELNKYELAEIGQCASNSHYDVPSGTARQLAACMGGFSFADFKKPGTPISSKVIGEVLPRDYRLVLTKLYPKAILNERTDIVALGDIVHELRQVSGIIGARVLRDVTNDVLLEHAEEIRDELGDRALLRAFCYMGEIIRTLEASSYIITDDIERFINAFKSASDSRFKYIQSYGVAGAPTFEELAIAISVSDELLYDSGATAILGDGRQGISVAIAVAGRVGSYIKSMQKIFSDDSGTIISEIYEFSKNRQFRLV